MTVEEAKQLTPDVRVNRGIAVVTPKDGASVATRYVSISVKTGDRWLISQLTETDAPRPRPIPGCRPLVQGGQLADKVQSAKGGQLAGKVQGAQGGQLAGKLQGAQG